MWQSRESKISVWNWCYCRCFPQIQRKHHIMPKKPKTLNRLHAKKLCHNMQKNEVMLTRCAMSSKSKPWTPNVNRVLQIWTVSSNSQPWAPILNPELHRATPKFTKTSKLHRTVQNESRKCRNRLFIFYYILFYIICILFLLYIILYYMYCHNSIVLLGIVFFYYNMMMMMVISPNSYNKTHEDEDDDGNLR